MHVWWLSVNPELLLDLDSPGPRAKRCFTTIHGKSEEQRLDTITMQKWGSKHSSEYSLICINPLLTDRLPLVDCLLAAFPYCLMGVWRSLMPPKMMRAPTPALLKMTEGSPTAQVTSPSQVNVITSISLNNGWSVWMSTVWWMSYLPNDIPTYPEATTITVAPEDSEVQVGDEIVLSCSASYDPMLDITFIWAIDFRVIDFDTEWQHYERMVGQWFI